MIPDDLDAVGRALLPDRRDEVLTLCDALCAARCVALVRDLRLFEVQPSASLPPGIDPRAAGVSASLVAHANALGALRQRADGRLVPSARMSAACPYGELVADNAHLVALDPIGFRWLFRGLDNLHAVLAGSVLAEEALFPRSDFSLVSDFYAESLVFSYYSRGTVALAQAVARAAHRPLRVLELGAGTGGTARRILEGLPAGNVQYVFTDLSPLLLAQAETALRPRFGDRLQLRLLDIDADGWEAAGQFDLILAQNVLHLARDVEAALGRARAALTPGGSLLLAEVSPPDAGSVFPFMDYTFGLLPSFRARSEGQSPLLRPDEWTQHLVGAGFASPRFLPLTRSNADDAPNYGGVYVATRPEQP